VTTAVAPVAIGHRPSGWTRFRRVGATGWLGASLIAVVVVITACAPVLAPHDPATMHTGDRLAPSSRTYPLGTDEFGRDLLTRLLYGSRYSLGAGTTAVAISLTAGTAIGLLSGYYPRFDSVAMRLMDLLLAFPGLLLALVIVSVLGPGLTHAMLAVGIAGIPVFARVVRSTALSVREHEYVEAAVALGSTDSRVLLRHVLPNCFAPIVVLATLSLGSAILSAAALSFLGLGAQPPAPEWGAMLNSGRNFITDAWWLTVYPGIAIMVAVLGFNLAGDALRDAIDPRLSRS